ncbi:MAG TPA: hypothetical protein PKV75_00020 [Desulfobacterales bacterium]|nr:hypothetical protein [Desulfobacterales bacterium]
MSKPIRPKGVIYDWQLVSHRKFHLLIKVVIGTFQRDFTMRKVMDENDRMNWLEINHLKMLIRVIHEMFKLNH